MARLFRHYNYSVSIKGKSGDFGVDLVITHSSDGKKIAVQAKRSASNVNLKAVQEVVSGKAYYRADEAWVVTNAHFAESAKKLAAVTNVRLIDREDLVKLLNTTRKK